MSSHSKSSSCMSPSSHHRSSSGMSLPLLTQDRAHVCLSLFCIFMHYHHHHRDHLAPSGLQHSRFKSSSCTSLPLLTDVHLSLFSQMYVSPSSHPRSSLCMSLPLLTQDQAHVCLSLFFIFLHYHHDPTDQLALPGLQHSRFKLNHCLTQVQANVGLLPVFLFHPVYCLPKLTQWGSQSA